MKRLLMVVVLASITAMAQELSRQPFTDFKVPEVDAQGNLRWLLRGEKGRLQGQNMVGLEGVTVEFYNKLNQIDMTLKTSACVYDQAAKRAEGEERVEINAPGKYLITARGMDWAAGQNLIRLHHDGKIILSPNSLVGDGNGAKPGVNEGAK